MKELDSAVYTLLDTVEELQDRLMIQEKWMRKMVRILIDSGS